MLMILYRYDDDEINEAGERMMLAQQGSNRSIIIISYTILGGISVPPVNANKEVADSIDKKKVIAIHKYMNKT